MSLVAGNHNRHFDAAALGFERMGEWLREGPFALSHEPCSVPGHYVLAGHVHPGISVRDGWRTHRLPALRFGAGCGVLPAFGALTALHMTPAVARERIVAVTPAGLLPLGDLGMVEPGP